MSFSILQLNFLYIYKYCQSIHMDVIEYEDDDISDIDANDVLSLINCILFEQKLSTSINSCIFNPKVETYMQMPETAMLLELGAVNSGYINDIKLFKNKLTNLNTKINDRTFIYLLDDILSEIPSIKQKQINVLNARPMKSSRVSNKDVIDILF